MSKPVGFDQKIQLSHLNTVAEEIRFTAQKDLYAKLDEYLCRDIQGNKARKNAITILMKTWCLVALGHQELQTAAIKMFPEAGAEEKLVLHWGMLLLAYPFFQAMAEEMGCLFRLQGEIPSRQLSRRIKLLYGDRRRVEVALTAVLSSLKAWSVVERDPKNIYILPHKIQLKNLQLKNWLLAVVLQVSEYKAMPLEMLKVLDVLFPFIYDLSIMEIDSHIFNIERQGMDTYVIRSQNSGT